MALQISTDQQNPKYDQQGMLIPGTGGLPTGGWAALLQVTPQQQPQQQQQQATVDPVTKFNQGILDMLKQAQGFSTAPLSNEANRLGVQQINNSMAPASQLGVDNLRPGDALNARQRAGQLYDPEIKNLNDRIVASRQAIDSFKDALTEARKYSEEYAKSIKPDEQTIKGVQDMLIAGETPGKDVLDAVYKYIDWAAVAAGKKTSGTQSGRQPADVEKYEYYKAEQIALGKTPLSFQEYDDRQSQYKKSTNNTYINADSKALNADQNTVANIIQKYPATGTVGGKNNVANGAQWDAAAAEIERVLKVPASQYDFMLQAAYIPKTKDSDNPYG